MISRTSVALLMGGTLALSTALDSTPQDPGPTVRMTPQVDRKKAAWSLAEADNLVRRVRFQVMESAPPQFDLQVTLWMPSPGWKLAVDKIERQDGGRIVTHVTGTRPKGMAAAVMTDTDVSLRLGYVPEGDLLVEVWYRDAKGTPYRRRGVALLTAAPARRGR